MATTAMTASLIGIDGRSKGAVFPVENGHLEIGRDEGNNLVLEDSAASRCHCSIQLEGSRYSLIDLESRNGTFVNGVPVHKRVLAHGDEIRIGRSVFLFVLSSAEPGAVSPISDPSSVQTRATVKLRLEDAVYLNPDHSVREAPLRHRAERDLKALLRISSDIHRVQTRTELFDRLLRLTLQVIPAERAAVFTKTSDLDGCEFAAGLDRSGVTVEPFAIDPALARQVLVDCLGVIADSFESAAAAGAALSILSAPLIAFERIHGLLYLDNSDRTMPFSDDDLQFLSAVSSLGGLAFEKLSRMETLKDENIRLKEQLRIQHDMVGESSAMRGVYSFIAKVAQGDATVLIGGENGTGKELAARAIHDNSARAGKPFIAINCAALTESLLESDLFGHEKGAFTGAIAQKKGKFELAHSGTIFLDEVGELAPAIQGKLLRVLQQREFERVGGSKTIKVDVRVIAATNRDLQAAIKGGTFRQDLFFRLNVIALTMPALRDRREDIPLLVNFFVKKSSAAANRTIEGISQEARAWLLHYDWPGNVRELENAIERAVVMGASDLIMPEDLPETILEAAATARLPIDKYHEAVNEAKRDVVLRALQQAHGVQTEAAKLLGIHPVYLHRLMRKLNVNAADSAAGTGA